jgi:hypothetical protein
VLALYGDDVQQQGLDELIVYECGVHQLQRPHHILTVLAMRGIDTQRSLPAATTAAATLLGLGTTRAARLLLLRLSWLL